MSTTLTKAKKMPKMAFYRCEVSTYSRGAKSTANGMKKGSDTAALIAYRTGEALKSDYDLELKRPAGNVMRVASYKAHNLTETKHDFINKDKLQELTSLIDTSEKRKNSRVMRDVKVSLPKDLDIHQQQELADEVAYNLGEKYGTFTIGATHDLGTGNPHVHIALPTRAYDKDTNALTKKIRVLDETKTKAGKAQVSEIRELVANTINKFFDDKNINQKVDHRSYEQQAEDYAHQTLPKQRLINTRFFPRKKNKKDTRRVIDYARLDDKQKSILEHNKEIKQFNESIDVFNRREEAKTLAKKIFGKVEKKTTLNNFRQVRVNIHAIKRKPVVKPVEQAKIDLNDLINNFNKEEVVEKSIQAKVGEFIKLDRVVEADLSKIQTGYGYDSSPERKKILKKLVDEFDTIDFKDKSDNAIVSKWGGFIDRIKLYIKNDADEPRPNAKARENLRTKLLNVFNGKSGSSKSIKKKDPTKKSDPDVNI